MKLRHNDKLAILEENGFLILEDFLTLADCDVLRTRMEELTSALENHEDMSVFSTGADRHLKDRYFLESGNKIRFFLEENTERRVFNKCGHALHRLDPVFAKFSHSHKLQELFQDLGVRNPFIIQSMYIFKHADVGGEVSWHQDATFLFTEPNTVVGLWFALDDADRSNGCLWAIPGGHKTSLRSRFHRVEETQLQFTHYDESPFETEKAVPLEVRKGSLVILHSLLPHMSERNKSSVSRHAYTLHVYDKSSYYPRDNWLRTEEG